MKAPVPTDSLMTDAVGNSHGIGNGVGPGSQVGIQCHEVLSTKPSFAEALNGGRKDSLELLSLKGKLLLDSDKVFITQHTATVP